MSIELCVLGSGSSGNSSLLRLGGEAALIDAGFGPRTMAKRLAGTGVSLSDIRAMFLTHLDHDHFNPAWCAVILQQGIGVYLAEKHVGEFYEVIERHPSGPSARELQRAGLIQTFNGQPFVVRLGDDPAGVMVQPIHLQHDQQGSIGYALRCGEHRLGYATDLGSVSDDLIEAMADVHILAIESNYDHQMQVQSNRPAMLKRRVIGPRGHLSNDQAMDAIRRIVERSGRAPTHIVLLHLSRQCNCPELVRAMYAAHPTLGLRLRLSSQLTPTGWLRVPTMHAGVQVRLPGEQLAMFD